MGHNPPATGADTWLDIPQKECHTRAEEALKAAGLEQHGGPLHPTARGGNDRYLFAIISCISIDASRTYIGIAVAGNPKQGDTYGTAIFLRDSMRTHRRPGANTPRTGVDLPGEVTSPAGSSWSDWMSTDLPDGSGDWETIDRFPAGVCRQPIDIQCRALDGRDWRQTGQAYTCRPDLGGRCLHSEQGGGGQCLDYEVRVLCPVDGVTQWEPNRQSGQWTGWFDSDDPDATGDWETIDRFGSAVCSEPLAIECRAKDGRDWRKTGQVYACLPNVGGKCLNGEQRGAACLDYEVRFLCPAHQAR